MKIFTSDFKIKTPFFFYILLNRFYSEHFGISKFKFERIVLELLFNLLFSKDNIFMTMGLEIIIIENVSNFNIL